MATFLLLQSTSGIVSSLAAFSHSCRNGMVMRLALNGGVALVWPDEATPMEFRVSPAGTGQPGVGISAPPAGNTISEAQLGVIDRTAPPAVSSQSVAVSAFRTRADVQWEPISLDPNSSGLAGYFIYRDGNYFLRTAATTFSDETVKPGESHTYTIYALNQHETASTATAVTATSPVAKAASSAPPLQSHAVGDLAEKPRTTAGTPPADSGNGLDPRRTGVRVFGSYWGAAGEQIDTTSGNLSFSVPLIKAMARGNWSIQFVLSYNSQMWRKDTQTWFMGQDVGYGLGWKLQAGSITPIWTNTSQIDYYLYTDSTGAEYSLSVNNGSNVWTSLEGIYISYDANAQKLYSTDGSFWVMGSQSSSGEQDSGTLYPTTIEDSNGNQITVQYEAGAGTSSQNTSARIANITDCRVNGVYTFTYNSDSIPHLTSISNTVGTSENYSLSFLESQALSSPFTGASYGTTTFLQSAAVTGLGVSHSFQYSGSGEMTQLTTPLGGVLSWQYRSFTYGTGITMHEVNVRQLQMLSGGTSYSYAFQHPDSYDETIGYHSSTTVVDPSNAEKQYAPSVIGNGSSVPYLTVPTQYEEINANGSTPLVKAYSWSQNSAGNTYMSNVVTTLDQGTSNAVESTTTQTLDGYGNLTQSQVYDYGNSSTPARTYALTYLTNTSYTSIYIRNRLTQATVTTSAGNLTLASNTYDSGNLQGQTLTQHDSTYNTSFVYRGNPTTVVNYGDTNQYVYDIGGNVVQVTDGAGKVTTVTPSSSTNYSLPGVLTPNSNTNLQTSLSYANSFAATSVAGPNGATASTSYDSYGRPQSSQIPDGATTEYSYTYNPNVQTAAVMNDPSDSGGNYILTQTVLDGFGRTISVGKAQSGYSAPGYLCGGPSLYCESVVNTQYAPCACSSLGKVSAVSEPYPPGGTPIWTTYTYDGRGRTLTKTAPDGSVTQYSYSGNNTTVTDPAGKWKTFTRDTFGNLTVITEPRPGGGANYATNYTYNGANQLTNVQLVRDGVTEQRSFQWSGTDLVSATNPENGTISYAYDGAHHLTARTDQKGQLTKYLYDTYGRVTNKYVYPQGLQYPPDNTQAITYAYDILPASWDLPGNPTYTWGRLVAVAFGGGDPSCGTSGDYNAGVQYFYTYSYNPAGRVTSQFFQALVTQSGVAGIGSQFYPCPYFAVNQTANYLWDTLGRLGSVTYPSGQEASNVSLTTGAGYGGTLYPTGSWNATNALTYTYDPMGHLNGMTDSVTSTTASAYYGTSGASADEMQYIKYGNVYETFTYNNLLQLTGTTATPIVGSGTLMSMQYTYPSGSNNGRISQSIDGVLNQTVNYTYDSLNRLSTALATNNSWGQSYSYDGFGNLTAKTVTAGSAMQFSASYNANNQPVGSGYDFDANGNSLYGPYDPVSKQYLQYTFDAENRIWTASDSGTPTQYSYDPQNHRVGQITSTGSGSTQVNTSQFTFYSVTGQRLDTFTLVSTPGLQTCDGSNIYVFCFTAPTGGYLYFGKKLLFEPNGTAAVSDRLGSVRNAGSAISYYPWGEEMTSTSNGQVKFGTYFRDMAGQDYANQRYYSSTLARFYTPDPKGRKAVNPKNPTSWNMYAYVNDDPVDFGDPSGLELDDDEGPDAYYGFNSGSDGGFGVDEGPAGYIVGTDPNDPLTAAVNASVNSGTQIPDQGIPLFSTSSVPAYSSYLNAVAAGVVEGAGALTQASTWAQITGASLMAGTGVGALMTFGATTAVATSALVAGATPVIGSLPNTTSWATVAGYNVLYSAVYSEEIQAEWIAEQQVSGQSFLLASPPPPAAATSMYATEYGYLTSQGYQLFGNLLVPPVQ